MDVCSSYKYGSDIGLERLSRQSKIISINIRISLLLAREKVKTETYPISEIIIIILSLKYIGLSEAAAFSFTNLFFPRSLGSISAALSCLVYPPREESSGEECRLLSRTVAGNRAYA